MSHIDAGPLPGYNSLLDPHLAGFFSTSKMRRHLKKAGLVTRKGEIVSETTYRLTMARKEHKKHVRDLLAQAIVHKTLDLERTRQVQIKKKLEEIAKIELVRRVRAERGRKGDEDVLPYLSPRPPTRGGRPSSVPSGKTRQASRPMSAPAKRRSSSPFDRPKSALGHTDKCGSRPIFIDEDGYPVDSTAKSDGKRSPYPTGEIDSRHLYALDQTALKEYTLTIDAQDRGQVGPSPYTLSQVPTPPPKGSARSGSGRRSAWGRKKKNQKPSMDSDKPNLGKLMLHRLEPAVKYQERYQSFCEVTMHYFGSSLQLDYEKFDPRDEVMVEQQHCGGNTLTVFREKILPESDFTFFSRRHRGYPFSLTMYVNGVLDCRISACCEYKHRKGAKLGGKQGHFGLVCVEGAAPCYKCQIDGGSKDKKKKKKKEEQKEEVQVPVQDDEKDEKPQEEEKVDVQGEGDEAGPEDNGNELEVPVQDDAHTERKQADYDSSSESDSSSSGSSSESEDDYADDFEDEKPSDSEKNTSVTQQSDSAPQTDRSDAEREEKRSKSTVGGGEYDDDDFEDDDEETPRPGTVMDTPKIQSYADSDEEDDRELETKASSSTATEVEVESEIKEPSKNKGNGDVEYSTVVVTPQEALKETDDKYEKVDSREQDRPPQQKAPEPPSSRDETDDQTYLEPVSTQNGQHYIEITPDPDDEQEPLYESIRISDTKDLKEDTSKSSSDNSHTKSGENSSQNESGQSTLKDMTVEMEKVLQQTSSDSDKEKHDSGDSTKQNEELAHSEVEESEDTSWTSSSSSDTSSDSDSDDDTATATQTDTRTTTNNNNASGTRSSSNYPETDPTQNSSSDPGRDDNSKQDSGSGQVRGDDPNVTSESYRLEQDPVKSDDPNMTSSSDQAGGNDPDNVAGDGTPRPIKLSTLGVTPGTEHQGSIRPLVEGKKDVDLTSVSLRPTQVAELGRILKEEDIVESLVLRNGSIDDLTLGLIAKDLAETKSKLQMLNLNCNQIGSTGACHLVEILKSNPDIQMLLLHANPLGDEGVREVVEGIVALGNSQDAGAEVKDGAETRQVHDYAKQIVDGVIKEAMESDSLREGMIDSSTDQSDVASTRGSQKSVKVGGAKLQLRELDLGDCQIGQAGATAVAELISNNQTVDTLSLVANPNIPISGWVEISQALKSNKTIKTLTLDYNNLGDDGATVIADALTHNKSLQTIDLESNGIGDQGGAKLLEMVKANHNIKDVTLMPGNNMSDDLIGQFKQVLLSRTQKL